MFIWIVERKEGVFAFARTVLNFKWRSFDLNWEFSFGVVKFGGVMMMGFEGKIFSVSV